MITAVIGSRGFTDYPVLQQTLDLYKITEIISGGAKGADTMAEQYAKEKGIPTRIFKPQYEKYGSKIAPLKRNEEIISVSEQVIAFWDGKSRGTAYALNYAQRQGKFIHVFSWEGLAIKYT